MKDPRITKMAQNLIHHSVKLQPGENVLIEVTGTDFDLAKALVKEAYVVGGNPFVNVNIPEIEALMLKDMGEEHMKLAARLELDKMQQMQAYLGVRGNNNVHSGDIVPPEKGAQYRQLFYQPVHLEQRVKKTKWCVLRVPNNSMAQNAGMSTDTFQDLFYDVCALDYARLAREAEPLRQMMEKADRVRLTGKGTDLTFSIKGLPACTCAGQRNIPDGEIFSAPVKNSVNGIITYNLPGKVNDTTPNEIFLRFENGKIMEVKGKDAENLEKTFNIDEGARYVGEFAIGINPKLTKPIMDTLFDEKISGSLHVTPGNCYQECDNGNYSAIHMDMIMLQTPEFGGGDIWLDDTLVRRDGLFVPKEMQGLNPENWA